jgi:L-lactate dehydrogenase complex protein LldG
MEEAMTSTSANTQVMDAVSRALGRTAPPKTIPQPPEIDQSIARLVQQDHDLSSVFVQQCQANKINVQIVSPPLLEGRLIEFLQAERVRRVAVSGSLEHLRLVQTLHHAGLDAKAWDQMSLDDLYDVDCGITDVYCAVAETGSLVVRASQQARAVSLVPTLHVAIVKPGDIVPDLLDLFAKLEAEGIGSAVSLISGPSKTSDIEMTLVVGVHGPMKVQVFLVQ